MEKDYKRFRKFLDFFYDPRFTYEQYQTAYNSYIEYILENVKEILQFIEKPNMYMQLLRDNDLITAI